VQHIAAYDLHTAGLTSPMCFVSGSRRVGHRRVRDDRARDPAFDQLERERPDASTDVEQRSLIEPCLDYAVTKKASRSTDASLAVGLELLRRFFGSELPVGRTLEVAARTQHVCLPTAIEPFKSLAAGSFMRMATTTPEPNVMAATSHMAASIPETSATTPVTIAPIA
jgi:hypothetical protein